MREGVRARGRTGTDAGVPRGVPLPPSPLPTVARIARILRFAYLCIVHPGVRLVTRIHVDLLRSASALCL
ncbi:putative leader peptide [Streptomyces sp. NPDC057137]|uniref:putative leader peptide n=1 Tax=Streptomyces sp. NPDC057137 TaxID=3346030 RepID=UPI0036286E0D